MEGHPGTLSGYCHVNTTNIAFVHKRLEERERGPPAKRLVFQPPLPICLASSPPLGKF